MISYNSDRRDALGRGRGGEGQGRIGARELRERIIDLNVNS